MLSCMLSRLPCRIAENEIAAKKCSNLITIRDDGDVGVLWTDDQTVYDVLDNLQHRREVGALVLDTARRVEDERQVHGSVPAICERRRAFSRQLNGVVR